MLCARSIIAIPMIALLMLSGCINDLAEESAGGGLSIYNFDGQDAWGEENLVEVSMQSGDNLDWDRVGITISVDGGTPQTCSEGTNTGSSCEYESYQGGGNSYQWEVAEGITISGDCYDNCGCNVDVTITKRGVGSEDDKIVGQVSAYADMTS